MNAHKCLLFFFPPRKTTTNNSEDQKILQLYMSPYNHFGSYLSGVVIGYFLVRHKDLKINKMVQWILWVVSSVVAVVSLCGPYQAYQQNFPSVFATSSYYALARSSWSWSVGWIIYACATKRGGPVNTLLSWSLFAPLSSLSFLAYLVHPILMLFHTGRIRERIYFGHYELVNIWIARLVFSFLLAYIVHVVIEMPFASIETYIFPGRRKKKSDKKNSYDPRSKLTDGLPDLPSLTAWNRTASLHNNHSDHADHHDDKRMRGVSVPRATCNCCCLHSCKRRERKRSTSGQYQSSDRNNNNCHNVSIIPDASATDVPVNGSMLTSVKTVSYTKTDSSC